MTKLKNTQANNHLLLGGGCFWCLEAVFQQVEGVIEVTSGYSGGNSDNPTYQQICTGNTGHAEVVEIIYDSNSVTLQTLLSIFFTIHDPTTLNQQGNDVGTQYRSVIFYQDDSELAIINNFIEEHQQGLTQKIVTQVSVAQQFYPAEIDHHNYYQFNSSQPYCQLVIKPKLDKFVQWKDNKV